MQFSGVFLQQTFSSSVGISLHLVQVHQEGTPGRGGCGVSGMGFDCSKMSNMSAGGSSGYLNQHVLTLFQRHILNMSLCDFFSVLCLPKGNEIPPVFLPLCSSRPTSQYPTPSPTASTGRSRSPSNRPRSPSTTTYRRIPGS